MSDERDADGGRPPRCNEDFPIAWEDDHYVTRRELVKFLTLGSGLLAVASGGVAALGRSVERRREFPPLRLGALAALAPGSSLLFRYPSEEDPCILVRTADGRLVAYSQVCTHLSCAVIHEPGSSELLCPCHRGFFAVEDGRPVAGPPTRRLPRIRLETRGDDEIWAIGVEL